MAVTAALVYAAGNRLRYLLTQDGAAGTTLTITASGAATPDLVTDSVGGQIKQLAQAPTAGYGSFAAGALTQAQARALWLSDWGAGAASGPGAVPGPMEKTAECELTPRSGATASAWLVDVNVSVGVPILSISAQAGAATAYLDVEIQNAIGA